MAVKFAPSGTKRNVQRTGSCRETGKYGTKCRRTCGSGGVPPFMTATWSGQRFYGSVGVRERAWGRRRNGKSEQPVILFVDNQRKCLFSSHTSPLRRFLVVFFLFPQMLLCGNCIVAFRLHATNAAHALGPNAAGKTPAKKGGPQKGLRTPRRNVSRGRLATRYCNAPSLRRSVPCGQTARRNVR